MWRHGTASVLAKSEVSDFWSMLSLRTSCRSRQKFITPGSRKGGHRNRASRLFFNLEKSGLASKQSLGLFWMARHKWLYWRSIWLDKQPWTRLLGQQANTKFSYWPACIDFPIDIFHRAEAASLAKRLFQGATGVCVINCASFNYHSSHSIAENVQQQPLLVRSTSSTGRILASYSFVVAILIRVACYRLLR